MMDHHVKALPRWFPGYVDGSKTWSLRTMDRDYQVGDRLVVAEWERGFYTGRRVARRILRVDTDFLYVIEEGHGILSLGPPEPVIQRKEDSDSQVGAAQGQVASPPRVSTDAGQDQNANPRGNADDGARSDVDGGA